MPAPKSIYRPILVHAVQTAWRHRELWPLAAIAGLAGTGAVVNDVFQQSKFALNLPSGQLSQSWRHLLESTQAQNLVFSTTPSQVLAVIFGIFGAMILAGLAIAACQQTMLRLTHRAAVKKLPLPYKEVKRELNHPRLLRFISLDLLAKLIVINLMMSVAILVADLDVSHSIPDAAFGIIFALSAFCVSLVINILVMLALISVARQDLNITEALAYAWRTFKTHPIICLEMSFLLFGINFVITGAFNGAVLVLGVPALFSFAAALQLGSTLVSAALMSLAIILNLALTLAFAGFATTFTYAVWTALAEYLDKKPAPQSRLIAHGQRFLVHVRS